MDNPRIEDPQHHVSGRVAVRRTSGWVVAAAVGMFCLAFAAVPLYRVFCKATGFAGTPRIATEQSTQLLAEKRVVSRRAATSPRTVRVQLDANIDAALPWRFYPEQAEVSVQVGEPALVFYVAENTASYPITGMAVYNVVPERVAAYFTKIHCFCFEEQTLRPKEKVRMPVTFILDEALEQDKGMDGVGVMTLSYHFFKVDSKE